MIHNQDEKIDNKNSIQPKEISRKNNLSIDCPSFIPNNLKKYNNSNDNSNDNVNIRLNECILYFSHTETFSQESKYNEEDKNKDSTNIVLNINAKEYIPKNNRENEDSDKKGYIEPITNSIEENQKKKENSQNFDYSYLENLNTINFKSFSEYSNSSKSSSSTNINA